MTKTSAQNSLDDAARLATATRRAARWYANYLLAFAGGTVLLSVLIGIVPGPVGVGIGMACWLALLIGLTVYQRRQQAKIRRFTSLHLIVIITWASLWIITVMVGNLYFPGELSWWLPAGIVTALPALVGAIAVYRATR